MYKVLFVDDEPWVIIDLLHNIQWKKLGFDVIGHYERALEAKAVILSENPNLVFVDINMPVLNGFDLIRQCREAGSSAEFIILSAYSDFEFAKEAIKAEVLDYCLKPVNPDSMISTLKEIQSRLDRKKITKTDDTSVPEALSDDYGYIPDSEARFNRIMDFIKNQYNSQLSLSKLGNRFSLNKNYICYLFKKYTGSTFSKYLATIRVEKSKQMLESSDIPIQIIAEKTGFADAYYFNKVFKSVCGIPPHKYRMLVKNRDKIP